MDGEQPLLWWSASRKSLRRSAIGGPFLIFGCVLILLDPSPPPTSSNLISIMVGRWPMVRMPLAVTAGAFFSALWVLVIRLWRGEPLIEATGETLVLARPWGRRRISRGDITALAVTTRTVGFLLTHRVTSLEVHEESGKRRRVGFRPDGGTWTDVIEQLDEWMRS